MSKSEFYPEICRIAIYCNRVSHLFAPDSHVPCIPFPRIFMDVLHASREQQVKWTSGLPRYKIDIFSYMNIYTAYIIMISCRNVFHQLSVSHWANAFSLRDVAVFEIHREFWDDLPFWTSQATIACWLMLLLHYSG